MHRLTGTTILGVTRYHGIPKDHVHPWGWDPVKQFPRSHDAPKLGIHGCQCDHHI
uniref:Uncharacterized protein n=1 Tax=Arundo donax TaxID=35708 RepID=A0A0A9T3V9_ARUDO